jgi:ferric-dicitrate binding protein FerR (iron transport regulator)
MIELLHSAGLRPAASREVTMRVRAAVQREFLRHGAQRRRHRQRWLAAAAAGLLALTCGALFTQRFRSHSVVIAHVTRIVGETDAWTQGAALRTGQTLMTPSKVRMLLAHDSGVELRLDEHSRLVFVDSAHVRLEQGAVYVETHREASGGAAAHLTVLTPFGEVSHVGTRFEVRVEPLSLTVRVRDGASQFRPLTGAVATLSAGDRLDYRAGDLSITHDVAPEGTSWGWVEQTAPAYDIEGRNLLETLEWLAHEGGYELRFATDPARAKAAVIVLHGSIRGLTPREAIEVVLNGTEMRHAIVGDQLEVSLP